MIYQLANFVSHVLISLRAALCETVTPQAYAAEANRSMDGFRIYVLGSPNSFGIGYKFTLAVAFAHIVS